jgi:hypothetical protein
VGKRVREKREGENGCDEGRKENINKWCGKITMFVV